MNIVYPPFANSSRRLDAFDCDRLHLNELAANLGTPDEWLASAVDHLKARTCAGHGDVRVSVAALHLVLMRLEALEHGGDFWPGNAA